MHNYTIELFTDGACKNNPGSGGYGVLLRCGKYEKRLSQGFILTTNNRMELLATIVGLESIKWDNARVELWTDSSYIVNAINKGWLLSWIKKDFVGKKNRDLWLRFYKVYKKHKVTLHWVKGHNGHIENEICDNLAVEARLHVEQMSNPPRDEAYEAEVNADKDNSLGLI